MTNVCLPLTRVPVHVHILHSLSIPLHLSIGSIGGEVSGAECS